MLLWKNSHTRSIDEKYLWFWRCKSRNTNVAGDKVSITCWIVVFALVNGNAVPVHLSRLSTSLGRNQAGTYKIRTGVPNSRRKLSFGKLRKDVHTTFTVKANVAQKLQICPLVQCRGCEALRTPIWDFLGKSL